MNKCRYFSEPTMLIERDLAHFGFLKHSKDQQKSTEKEVNLSPCRVSDFMYGSSITIRNNGS
ncbi:MAG: hypothetical protein D6730_03790 [Bacteroidetes bacterium]|nr:MAG: hypothetical protein D6730_03790 [Bacteroidota bacterium]